MALSTATYSCINLTSGNLLLSQVRKADRLLDRMRGLLGRDGLGPGEGLWIVPCKQVHTALMRFSLDVVFLDHDLKVLALRSSLRPWRISGFFARAGSVLEAADGVLAGHVVPGDQFQFVEQQR